MWLRVPRLVLVNRFHAKPVDHLGLGTANGSCESGGGALQRTFIMTCMCVAQVQAAAKGNAERVSEDGMDTDVPELAEVETFPAKVIDQLRAPPPQVALTMYHQKRTEVGFPCSTCCWSLRVLLR